MFNVKVNFKFTEVAKKVDSAFQYGQYVLDNAVIKDSNNYAPEDKGYLRGSAIKHSNPGSGEVRWVMPYARRLYYNPQYDFSKDKNPNAGGLWFERSKSEKLDEWIDSANKATKSRI